MTTNALDRATLTVTEDDLQQMVLERQSLPSEFAEYTVAREGPLDNKTMAEHGFPGSTAEKFEGAGRITGFVRELGASATLMNADGFNFVAATVAHLFDTSESVLRWMNDIFMQDFEEHVGDPISDGQTLASVEKLKSSGFFDESVVLKALHKGKHGELSTTIVDFRVGRILGVAYVGAVGDHERLELATQIGLSLEKSIVRVVLGAG